MKIKSKFDVGQKIISKSFLKFETIGGFRLLAGDFELDEENNIMYFNKDIKEYYLTSSKKWVDESDIFATKQELLEHLERTI